MCRYKTRKPAAGTRCRVQDAVNILVSKRKMNFPFRCALDAVCTLKVCNSSQNCVNGQTVWDYGKSQDRKITDLHLEILCIGCVLLRSYSLMNQLVCKSNSPKPAETSLGSYAAWNVWTTMPPISCHGHNSLLLRWVNPKPSTWLAQEFVHKNAHLIQDLFYHAFSPDKWKLSSFGNNKIRFKS